MYYSTYIIKQSFILNRCPSWNDFGTPEWVKSCSSVLHKLSESLCVFLTRAQAECWLSELHWEGDVFSAESFIPCSHLGDVELSEHTWGVTSEAVTEISPAWLLWHNVQVLFLAVLSPHFPPLHVSVLFWHWSYSSAQTRSHEPTQCEVGAANCAIKSIK